MNVAQSNQQMYEMCMKLIHQNVLVELNDGRKMVGVIESVNNQNVVLLVPEENHHGMSERGHFDDNRFGGWWGYPGFGYPYYGYPFYPGFGFRRLILPLAALTAISALPYFWW